MISCTWDICFDNQDATELASSKITPRVGQDIAAPQSETNLSAEQPLVTCEQTDWGGENL